MNKVRFNYADRKLNFSAKTDLKRLVELIFKKEGKSLYLINFIFCSDDFLLDINRTHLQHDYYTDIITFPLSEKSHPIEAEVYISLDRVKQNAKDNKQSFTSELLRVLTHGALHLCGYKDKSKSDIKTMREKEDYYILEFKKFHVKLL